MRPKRLKHGLQAIGGMGIVNIDLAARGFGAHKL
jgi:hypothetical protein